MHSSRKLACRDGLMFTGDFEWDYAYSTCQSDGTFQVPTDTCDNGKWENILSKWFSRGFVRISSFWTRNYFSVNRERQTFVFIGFLMASTGMPIPRWWKGSYRNKYWQRFSIHISSIFKYVPVSPR